MTVSLDPDQSQICENEDPVLILFDLRHSVARLGREPMSGVPCYLRLRLLIACP